MTLDELNKKCSSAKAIITLTPGMLPGVKVLVCSLLDVVVSFESRLQALEKRANGE